MVGSVLSAACVGQGLVITMMDSGVALQALFSLPLSPLGTALKFGDRVLLIC